VAEPDFDAWYVEQRPRVYLSMLAIGGSADLAADATDEAFTRAVAHWKRVRAMDSPGGWTQRVAMNVLRRGLGCRARAAGTPTSRGRAALRRRPHGT